MLKADKFEISLTQGFSEDFMLPEIRVRWTKLLGNSVSVPVVEMLGRAIIETGVFGDFRVIL
jgi:DNA (cytosine-5)-methyltransferase 1